MDAKLSSDLPVSRSLPQSTPVSRGAVTPWVPDAAAGARASVYRYACFLDEIVEIITPPRTRAEGEQPGPRGTGSAGPGLRRPALPRHVRCHRAPVS